MPVAVPAIDATLCPLCREPNRCALEIQRETGVKQPACWCTQLDFTAELLAEVPPEAENLSCICAACAGRNAGR